MVKRIFLIDSHAFLYKSYFALPKLITSKGEEVGALYGFVRLVFKIKEKTDYILACYDSPKNFRKEIYELYKANRKKTEDILIKQINLSKEICKLLGIKTIEIEGYEADDLIATFSRRLSQEGFEVIIVGGDKDLMQIVGGNIKLWDGKSDGYFSTEYVIKKYGVTPDRLFDYFTLVGDSSDNIPGVDGIGPKTAVKLLEKYGSLENILRSQDTDKNVLRIKNSIDLINLSKKLLELKFDAPLNIEICDIKVEEFRKEGIEMLVKRFEFREFLKDYIKDEFKDKKEMTKVENEEFINISKDYLSISNNFVVWENYYTEVNDDLLKKLLSIKVKKYTYNLKSLLHRAGSTYDANFDDIYLAYHLVYGGVRKPDIERIIEENFMVKPAVDASYFKDIMLRLEEKINELNIENLYRDEIKLSFVLYNMEKTGIRVDTFKLLGLMDEFDREALKVKNKFSEITGSDINLNSPKQLSNFLFNKLNLKLDKKYQNLYKTKTGGYSTSEEVLKLLLPYNPEVIGLILSYREYSKMKSFVEGLLKYVKDSKIHTNFDQTSTQTGRLSSSDPNLQNIPLKTKNGRKIRNCFIPEDGFLFVSFDYSQIDLRVLAHLSEDEVLIEAFKNDEDIHVKTAKTIFKRDDINEDLRRIAKTINFGIIYGQTPLGLSIEANISYEEAKKYICNYFENYKGVKKWIDDTIIKARMRGYVENFFGRRRYLPDINSQNKALRSQIERMAINMPVQSGSSDIIKKAMILIYDIIKNNNDIRLLLQIHDELIFEVKENKVDEYIPKIKNIMESCCELKLPLKVNYSVGKNWAEL